MVDSTKPLNIDINAIVTDLNNKVDKSGSTMFGTLYIKKANALYLQAENDTAPSVILRNDGDAFYFLVTDENMPSGKWNSLRPFAFDIRTGQVRNGINKVVVETYVNGTSWYRVYSDGWIEQGGIYNGTITNGGNYSVSLLKNFSNTNYSIQVTGRQIAGKWGYSSVSNNSITTSSFQIMSAGNSSTDGTTQTFWYACGY